jgi:hypothetical protein
VTVTSEPGKGTVFRVRPPGNTIKIAMVPTETCDPMSGLGHSRHFRRPGVSGSPQKRTFGQSPRL